MVASEARGGPRGERAAAASRMIAPPSIVAQLPQPILARASRDALPSTPKVHTYGRRSRPTNAYATRGADRVRRAPREPVRRLQRRHHGRSRARLRFLGRARTASCRTPRASSASRRRLSELRATPMNRLYVGRERTSTDHRAWPPTIGCALRAVAGSIAYLAGARRAPRRPITSAHRRRPRACPAR